MRDGKTFLIEIKPHKETQKPKGQRRTKKYISEAMTYVKNMNKWEYASDYAKDQGYQFVIWTEKNEPLKSLIPKSTKPLKPFKKPYK